MLPTSPQGPIKKMFLDEYFPSQVSDIILMKKYYEEQRKYSQVIYLSIGETWSETAPGLREMTALISRADVHGYVFNHFGYPAYRRALREYIKAGHDLEERTGFEVASTSLGTRSVMADFGALLQRDFPASKKPVALCTYPGWDYKGVFAPLGFTMEQIALVCANGFQPVLEDFKQAAERLKQSDSHQLALVIINAQHNPTGQNWSEAFVRGLIGIALDQRAAILIDDAYFAIHDPDITPTSTLRILLEELAFHPQESNDSYVYPWIAVRSLGKQFHCNGWGLGAVTTHPQILERLQILMLERSYGYGSPLQHVMHQWITSKESRNFIARISEGYLAKRKIIARSVHEELGFPPHAFIAGTCTSYSLLAVPPAYAVHAHGARLFREHVMERTGVLLGDGNCSGPFEGQESFVRIFLGPSIEHIREALERFKKNEITYDMRLKSAF